MSVGGGGHSHLRRMLVAHRVMSAEPRDSQVDDGPPKSHCRHRVERRVAADEVCSSWPGLKAQQPGWSVVAVRVAAEVADQIHGSRPALGMLDLLAMLQASSSARTFWRVLPAWGGVGRPSITMPHRPGEPQCTFVWAKAVVSAKPETQPPGVDTRRARICGTNNFPVEMRCAFGGSRVGSQQLSAGTVHRPADSPRVDVGEAGIPHRVSSSRSKPVDGAWASGYRSTQAGAFIIIQSRS